MCIRDRLIACCDEFLKIFNDAFFSLSLNLIGKFMTFFSSLISSYGDKMINSFSPKFTVSPVDIINSFEKLWVTLRTNPIAKIPIPK